MEGVPHEPKIESSWSVDERFLDTLTISVDKKPVLVAKFDGVVPGVLVLDWLENLQKKQENPNPVLYAKVFKTFVQVLLSEMKHRKTLMFHLHNPILFDFVKSLGARMRTVGDDEIGEITVDQLQAFARAKSIDNTEEKKGI